ncbi:MAG: glycosyltransferase family 2 protein [Planctomycetota bacterium]|jgi:GT2 family glycosyltransferase
MSENNIPSLSIVFPTHNEEALIARAMMEALALQDEYPAPVEIIAACNGCTDRSADIARLYPVTVIDDERSGMSFGNNLGGKAANNDLIMFWDVDTFLEAGALADLAETVKGKTSVAGGMYTRPDKVYPRSSAFFWIMNFFCRKTNTPAAGVVIISREVYQKIDGFDESIPQGTGSDLVRRALAEGAEFVYVPTKKCRTSVRRFEKRGYMKQLLDWKRNIKLHSSNKKEDLAEHNYDVIR